MTKISDIRNLSDAELVSKKKEARQEIFNLRLQQQTGRLEKPSRLRELKRQIAHIETVATERKSGKTVAAKAETAPKAPKAKAKKAATAEK
ncbi:MAG: 50S ribosomal protein L29 [Verrucomicrobium sp.]|nr:50S ribosomal protein L29 [Verrucomicrobium sp.]